MNITYKALQNYKKNCINNFTDQGMLEALSERFGEAVNLVNDDPELCKEIPPPGFTTSGQNKYNTWTKENPVLKSTRQQILEEAIQCVTKDRNAIHGECEDNFQNIADFWNCWLSMRGVYNEAPDVQLQKYDVAVMMDLMKTSRLVKSPENRDHWVDKAGYSACGAQCIVGQKASHPMDLPK